MIVGKAEVFMITKDGKLHIKDAYITSLEATHDAIEVTGFGLRHKEFVRSSGEGHIEMVFPLSEFYFEKNGKDVSEKTINAARLPRKMDVA